MDQTELVAEDSQQENDGFNDEAAAATDDHPTETPDQVDQAAAQQEAEPEPEYARLTKAEYEDLKARAATIDQIRATQDKGFGTFGETIRGIKSELQAMKSGKKFDISAEKVAQFRDDGFPEIADALEFLSGMHSAPAEPAPSAVDIATQVKQVVEKRLLSRDHPDWEQIGSDPAFTAYVSNLPAERQQVILKASNEYDSFTLSKEMTAFKQSIQKTATGKTEPNKPDPNAARRRIMQASITPRGNGSAHQSAGSTEQAGFDSVN